jgi:hypothetical protein
MPFIIFYMLLEFQIKDDQNKNMGCKSMIMYITNVFITLETCKRSFES